MGLGVTQLSLTLGFTGQQPEPCRLGAHRAPKSVFSPLLGRPLALLHSFLLSQPGKAIQMRQEDYWYSRAGPKSLRSTQHQATLVRRGCKPP